MSRCRHGIGTIGGCRYCLVGLGADMVPPLQKLPVQLTVQNPQLCGIVQVYGWGDFANPLFFYKDFKDGDRVCVRVQ